MLRGYYVHNNAMDVYIQVLKVQYRGPTYTKMRVTWMNMGFTNNPWPILVDVPLQLSKEDEQNWKPFWPATGIKAFRAEQALK